MTVTSNSHAKLAQTASQLVVAGFNALCVKSDMQITSLHCTPNLFTSCSLPIVQDRFESNLTTLNSHDCQQ